MRDSLRTTACVAALVLALGAAGPAAADRDDVDLPSKQRVRDARALAAQKASDVGRIKAALLLANRRLADSAVAAEQASEAYNGARWRLEQAGTALDRARSDAAQARREVVAQRDAIGALVASSYQQGTEVTALSAMMSADGPEGVLDQYVAFQGASTAMEADYQRFAATDALAKVFARRAVAAERRQRAVAAQAEEARRRAVAAVGAAQAQSDAVAVEKDVLIHELATAQDISVKLARKRQAALEELARQRAAERARKEALAAARAEARAQRAAAAAAAKAAAEKAAQQQAAQQQAAQQQAAQQQAAAEAAAAAAAQAQADKDKQPATGPSPDPAQPVPGPPAGDPAPVPVPPVPAPPPAPAPPAGGASAAIAFATAQVGDPYLWGASGPDAWDCSGLTMEAWRSGGISLPHYSVAQYYAGTPLTVSQLQPGDLVFWSSSSSPQGIHHVALYLGGGTIVHAPRTGRPVAVESMYAWIPPTHFVRP